MMPAPVAGTRGLALVAGSRYWDTLTNLLIRATLWVILFKLLVGCAAAQTPTGFIAGVVRDASGGAVPGAQVKLESKSTAFGRTVVTSGTGDYSFPALLAGEYEVTVDSPGFRQAVRQAVVEAGSTTTTDFSLQIGDTKESVTAESSSPQMHFDSPSVNGLITRDQIENLPLNGRSFLELAKLEPGGQPPTRQNNNRALVPVLTAPSGNSGRGTRVTVDGGSIMAIGYTGSAMGFSQEAVQEFQVSAVGFDLATGITDQGSINVVTRSGANAVHGAALYFFRDHTLAAYPALKRDAANPDPFFQRRQFGFAIGGPVVRDRVFFFANWERNEQRGVAATTLLTPEFAHFSRVTPTPLFGDLLSVRFDAALSHGETAFVRYSHDGSRGFSSNSPANAAAYPSQWFSESAWSDQSLLGLTSVVRPTVVNDFRFSYLFTSSGEGLPREQDCPGCLGLGAPAITIAQAGLSVGSSTYNVSLARQFQFTDAITWQHGRHRIRFGGDWEHHRGGNTVWQNVPVSMTLFSTQQARQYNLPMPGSFDSVEDLLRLPLQSFTVAVGDPRVPEEGGGTVRNWNTYSLYFQDTWRVSERVTANFGLAWNVDRNLNYDLPKPALLAPILGAGGLGPTQKQWRNFSPVVGFVWAPSADRKTILRAGTGMFYDSLISPNLDPERAILGPPGVGLQTFSGSSILNPIAGVAGVPVGTPLNFPNAPTAFTGENLMSTLPSIRTTLVEGLSKADPAVQAIQVSKQASGPGLFPADYKGPGSALEASGGVQREIARDFVISADFAYRHFLHLDVGGVGQSGIDLNQYNSIHGPVIAKCSGPQRNDVQAICSLGPIDVHVSPARATYRGLLLRAEKRLSNGLQILGSYAYSNTAGTNGGNGLNLDNWLQNTGPLATDIRHILNLSAIAQLPARFQLGLTFAYSSTRPFSAYVGPVDFNGDGTQGDLLPGTTVNAFNRGSGRTELERLVADFNNTLRGTLAPIVLPPKYSFGDDLQSLDLRLSRSFALGERRRASLIGEVFNLYNQSNLTGYSGDLTNRSTFGQPTGRATQVFGSGGPRAFQLAVRFNF
jgi:Carboxypeptidase regulatory-like domain